PRAMALPMRRAAPVMRTARRMPEEKELWFMRRILGHSDARRLVLRVDPLGPADLRWPEIGTG
ncbi:hypothetical protein NJI34_38120, partial [Pseudomonas sp. S 311-6]|nr:hypothetical protein [Pseudomonas sp. S 311-6]